MFQAAERETGTVDVFAQSVESFTEFFSVLPDRHAVWLEAVMNHGFVLGTG